MVTVAQRMLLCIIGFGLYLCTELLAPVDCLVVVFDYGLFISVCNMTACCLRVF